MELYLSFPNDAILDGVAPPEGFLEDQLETTISRSVQPVPTDPIEQAAAEEAAPVGRPQEEPSTSQTPSKEPTGRVGSPIWFPGWREVLHPSRPVTAARQVPPTPQESKQRPHSQSSGGRKTWH